MFGAELDPRRAMMATRQVQRILQLNEPSLIADGRWGSYTNGAYARAPAAMKDMVRKTLDTYGPGYTPAALYEQVQSRKAPKGGSSAMMANYLPADKVRALLERAYVQLDAARVGISMDSLTSLAAYEAAQKTIDGVKYYSVDAVNKLGYTGLYQFGPSAWKDAQAWSPWVASTIGSFQEGAKDAWKSTVAMVAFAMSNATALRKRGYKGALDARTLYGAHQQGVSGYLRFLKDGSIAGTQSKESVAFLKGKASAKQLA